MTAADPERSDLRFFNPAGEFCVVHRHLPHWSQAGTISFITWRTHDSMPGLVLDQWRNDRSKWLRAHGVDPQTDDPYSELHAIDPVLAQEFAATFQNRWHDALDAGHGACVLRDPQLSKIVATSLQYFDEDRYLLLDFVVMPNHVHLLVSFPDETTMLRQCRSWKQFIATSINLRLNRQGRFWQQDSFDHLVRSQQQFVYLRDYIAKNPAKAHLNPHEFIHYSKPLPSSFLQ